MEASDQKRRHYQELIKDIPKERLVYIDESCIDISISKDRGWGKRSKKLIGKKSGKYYQRTKDGASKRAASKVFNVSETSIYRWLKNQRLEILSRKSQGKHGER